MICYNLRFKGHGIYSFPGKKVACPVLWDRFPTAFVFIFTTKFETYSFGIHVGVLELELNYHYYVGEERGLKVWFPQVTQQINGSVRIRTPDSSLSIVVLGLVNTVFP